MQLSELNSYVKFIDDSLINNQNSQTVYQTCLEALQQGSTYSLDATTASMISTLLHSYSVGMENLEETIPIERALAEKMIIDKSASSFVFEWLDYRYDKRLCSFAYQGALLLGLSHIWTPTIVEICCQLLSSEYDHYRDSAIQLIETGNWDSDKQINSIIINYIDQWNKQNSKWISEIEYFFDSLDIQMIDEMDSILKLERKMFENKSDINEVSLFWFIKKFSSEVADYMITILQSLSTNLPDSLDLLFLNWLFEHIPSKLFEDNENFINFLIKILSNPYPIQMKVLAARELHFFRQNKQVETVLWNLVINNEQEDAEELVGKCIWSLFINRKDDHFKLKRLKKLDHLREHTHSLFIRQAIISAMYSQIITEPEKYHIADVYHSYMANDDFDRASDWVIKHSLVLLPQLIDDIYKGLNHTLIFHVSDCVRVARKVCKEIPNEFRVSVRQSSIKENAFLKGLYEMSKRVTSYREEDYFHIYACFEQVSPDFVMMFSKLRLDKRTSNSVTYSKYRLDKSLSSDYFQSLRFVSEYQSVELLIDMLQSSLSLKQRYIAAELLVHLTTMGQVSATEVQNLLTKTIDDVQSQKIIDLKIYHKFKSLLLRLMVKEPDPVSLGEIIVMNNETLHVPIPAALFQIK
jgi:hypothetical protein